MKAKMILPGLLALVFLSGAFVETMSQEKQTAKVYEKVEIMPKFEGKEVAQFNAWVMKTVVYPKDALKEGISGKVYASFVVASDGTVRDVKIKKSAHKYLDEEVIRVIKTSPKWTPGYNENKAVDVSITIPVDFKLSN